VPAALQEKVKQLRHELLEACVEHDGRDPAQVPRGQALTERRDSPRDSQGDSRGHIVPVICGAAFKNKGVQALLDAVVDYLPSPVDIPPIKGHLPHHDATHAERRRRTRRRSPRWRSRS